MLIMILGILAQATASSAVNPPAPTTVSAQSEVDGPPAWCPNPKSTRYYPAKAARREVEGSVVLTCRVTDFRRFTDCVIEKEEPAGYGFGDAAQVMAQCLMKGDPGSDDRRTFPINFKLPRG